MPNRYCAVCSALLTGKQRRFCSDSHRSVFWNDLRERALALPPGSTDDPELVSFVRDLANFIRDHEVIIDKLLELAKK